MIIDLLLLLCTFFSSGGHVVHRPNSAYEGGDEDLTREKVKLRFGEDFDWELWTNVKLSFRDQLGDSKLYEVNALQPISCHFYSYAISKEPGDDEDDYRFVYEEKDIQEGDTPSSLGMTIISSDSEIVVSTIHKYMVKFAILHSNGDAYVDYLTGKETPLLDSFELFATEHLKDVSRKDLVFSFNGRRLYTFDTAATLNLSDNDVIDATPVKEYHSEGCICCQKKQNPLAFATER